jgi:hypothetical protein
MRGATFEDGLNLPASKNPGKNMTNTRPLAEELITEAEKVEACCPQTCHLRKLDIATGNNGAAA